MIHTRLFLREHMCVPTEVWEHKMTKLSTCLEQKVKNATVLTLDQQQMCHQERTPVTTSKHTAVRSGNNGPRGKFDLHWCVSLPGTAGHKP